jgi:hypothetical protein
VYDEAGLNSARAFVEDLVKQEVANGIPSDNVLLSELSTTTGLPYTTEHCS